MNPKGSSSAGGDGGASAAGTQQPKPMHDPAALPVTDQPFEMLRVTMREKILEYIGRKHMTAEWRRRLPELARRLEVVLFTKFSNKNDYDNMMKMPFEPQLLFAIRTLMDQNQQISSRQMASSSDQGT